ncbi:MAG: hypothetical protein DMG23_07165 [Acidobacteria bacterium]|nr:MAG: hypothetical protein DMG23_07165 [Acidobacteriota bacterium]
MLSSHRSLRRSAGTSKTRPACLTTGAMFATGIVFFPAAPLFQFMHSKDIMIPKGTEITAYVNGDMKLEPGKFTPKPAETPAASAAPSRPSEQLSLVVIKSAPDGPDITADGKYPGSTLSTVRLSGGDHTVAIEKADFKAWQRAVTLSPGESLLNLEVCAFTLRATEYGPHPADGPTPRTRHGHSCNGLPTVCSKLPSRPSILRPAGCKYRN